jgi:hypothetical protein
VVDPVPEQVFAHQLPDDLGRGQIPLRAQILEGFL